MEQDRKCIERELKQRKENLSLGKIRVSGGNTFRANRKRH